MKKIILGIVFIIAISVVIFYYLGEQKEGTVLQVQVVVKGDSGSATIERITAYMEKVNKISQPKGTQLITPGVTVIVIQNMEIIGEWTSVPYSGTGIYNLTVGLIKNPNPGDTVRVLARVMNAQSQNIAVVGKEITLT